MLLPIQNWFCAHLECWGALGFLDVVFIAQDHLMLLRCNHAVVVPQYGIVKLAQLSVGKALAVEAHRKSDTKTIQ